MSRQPTSLDDGGGNSGPGSVDQGWSGAVVAVGPVLLVIPA